MKQTVLKIFKARQLTGRTLLFRDASINDAEFILDLRTNSRKSAHLSYTSPSLNEQIGWLERYTTRNDEAYFIIENFAAEKLGTVRLYDCCNDSFCWGSWVLKDGAAKNAAIESALMVYSYAIDNLGFLNSHFDVRKGNESVWRFHERFGAVRVGETAHDYLYKISQEQISLARLRYKRYLPDPVVIDLVNFH